ncbi:MAG: amino acid decarboxylase [Chloroflexi bacterium]|nr:amino acid decarboxylase [Chloroflexota bacterium]
MTNQHLGDMNAADFRQHGKELIDWIADYLENEDRPPVLSRVKPGDVKAQLPSTPPAAPECFEDVFADFNDIIMPGITHWNQPGFMAYFGITGSMPGILGELLTASLNVNGMLWRTSPSATELEEVVLNWLRQMVGLPEAFEGVVMDTASISSMIAVAAAREALNLRIREDGMAGRSDLPRLTMYTSDQSHSSIEKAGLVLGIGHANVRKIEVDADFRQRPDRLAAAIEADRRAGYVPFFACATVGTTSTTSIDPVPAIADICEREKVWLHVDGAYGGNAAIVPEMRWVLNGVERADSFVMNPHKWLFTPIDFSAFYTRHVDTLKRAFSILPEYLRTSEGDVNAVKNYMDYGVQLGRRFRALKFWFMVRTYGVDGIIARLREHIALAKQFESWVHAAPDWEVAAPVPFSTVNFRACPTSVPQNKWNALNENILAAVNATGEVFLSHTKLNDRYVIHLAIGNVRTEEKHIARAWELLQAECGRLMSNK